MRSGNLCCEECDLWLGVHGFEISRIRVLAKLICCNINPDAFELKMVSGGSDYGRDRIKPIEKYSYIKKLSAMLKSHQNLWWVDYF